MSTTFTECTLGVKYRRENADGSVSGGRRTTCRAGSPSRARCGSGVFGVILAIAVGVVIIGGIKRIGKVTEKLVPFMAVFSVTACFIVIGAASTLDVIVGFSDAMIFAMSIPNLIGVYLLVRVVKRELTAYEKGLESGEIQKVGASSG